MQNSKIKNSLSTTRTKAIQCEVLSHYPVSNSNSWKFIPPERLQKAIQKAKYDLGSMQSKSVVDCPSVTCSTKITVRDAISNLPNPSQHQIRNSIEVKPIIQKQKSHTPCCKDCPFSEVKRKIKPELCVAQNRKISPNSSGCQRQQLLHNEELIEEDLNWLGKNNSSNLNRRPVSTEMNSKSYIPNDCSLVSMSSTVIPKCHHKTNEAALSFVNRVQLREQQLWEQLAEISIISLPFGSSTRSSSVLANYEPILPNLPKEQDIITGIPGRQDCAEISSSQHSHNMLVDAENLVSLLGEEWLKNLLRNELEISTVG